MNIHIPLKTGILAALFSSSLCATSATQPNYPVVIGVDDCAGRFRMVKFWKQEAFFRAMSDLGATDLVTHVLPQFETDAAALGARLLEMDKAMRIRGITYAINNESPNWNESVELTPGVNEYEHPGDIHRWDLRMEWLNPLLSSAQSTPVFRGMVYDECDHMLLGNNKQANDTQTFDKPSLVDTTDMDLKVAFNALVAAAAAVRTNHYEGRVELNTEQVTPDLYHLFARAGWSVAPKALKEGFTPVVLSVALGAALQYADRTHFSITPDMWGMGSFPGHSISAVRSSLMMGYWLGAEKIYVENIDFNNSDRTHHPDATMIGGALIKWNDNTSYELTPYGEAFRDFARNYVPANPRPITWRDYRPRVAIVRLPDGCWGQTDTYSPNRNRLLGNRNHPSDVASREWLKVWSILTHGVVSPKSLNYWNKDAYPNGIGDFFVPLDSVAVFDHTVTGPVLDSVDCFVVCGHALSSETFAAIRARAVSGATVIIARRLYNQYVTGGQPTGDWLVVDDFSAPAVATKLQPFLGTPDVARYRFAHHMVEFHKNTADPDAVIVKVLELDADGDGMGDLSETAAERNPTDAGDLAFEFNTDESTNGWNALANITNLNVVGGSVTGTTINGDPRLGREGFLFDSAAVPTVIVKLKASATGFFQWFWGNTATSGYSTNRCINATYNTVNAWKTLIIPLAGHPEWDGKTIVKLRIDPISVGGATFAIDWIRASDGDLDNDGIADIDEGTGDSDGDGLLDIEDPATPYQAWAFSHAVSGSETDDDDQDSLPNLSEYALGGNPANPADRGHVPTLATRTSWLDYVHAKRSAPNSGITYTVEVADDLVAPDWTTNGVGIVGTGVLDAEFETVTNRISTETKTEQFIRLIIK